MKELQTERRKNGFRYIQIRRGDKSFVYGQYLNTDLIGFEVFERRVSKEHTAPNGIHFEEAEIFPHDEAFGLWAWSYSTQSKAMQKFEELENSSVRS